MHEIEKCCEDWNTTTTIDHVVNSNLERQFDIHNRLEARYEVCEITYLGLELLDAS